MNTSGVSPWHYLFLIPLAVFTLGVVLVWVTAAWEKRLVWPYVLAGEHEVPRPSTKIDHANRTAQSLSFRYLGLHKDGKGKLYNLRYDMWLSPDARTLAVIGCGTVASMPVQGASLHTLLGDGCRLVTVDNQSLSEVDLAGLVNEALVSGADIYGLLLSHNSRMESAAAPAIPFSLTDPLGDFRAALTRRIDRLAQRGYARFLDTTQNAWKYTLKGALVFATRAQCNGIRRVFAPDRSRRRQYAGGRRQAP
jgi:hypothetical protein